MSYHCGWIPFGKLFGVKMGSERLPKTMCKTCLNFEAILDAFWSHFGSLFWLRMVGPCKNFRSLRCSLPGLALGSAPMRPRGRFWYDFSSILMIFWASFLLFKAPAWIVFIKSSLLARSPCIMSRLVCIGR